MGKSFIAYDPELTRTMFNSDIIVAIYYKKLLNFDEILDKDKEGFFTVKSSRIEAATCIGRRQQERARRWLTEHNRVHCVLKVPVGRNSPQLHYQIIDKVS